ncbi:MAG: phage/plasmid primase, P4 family [Desulfurococcales archaeon]|nr:phage/plasmid primase, P4 family [Desulfurococcales archaeon]
MTGDTSRITNLEEPYPKASYGRFEELRVGRIRFEGRNKAVFNIGSKYTVVLIRGRVGESEAGVSFTVIILEAMEDGAIPKPPIIWYPFNGKDILEAKLEGLGVSEPRGIASAIAQVAEYFDVYRLAYEAELLAVRQGGFRIDELKTLSAIAIASRPTPREELAETLASIIWSRKHIISLKSKKGPLLCYKEGIYEECDDEIAAEIESLIEGSELKAKVSNRIVSEVMGKLYRRGARKYLENKEKIEQDRFYLAFKNGLFNVKEWVFRGVFELQSFNPSIYAVHKIPHRVDVNLFKEMIREEGLEILTHPVDIAGLAEKYTPKTWKAYFDWVGEPKRAVLLYEIEGYTLYPDYPLHRAFVLVGEGGNGKSNYLRKLEKVLGQKNVVSISLIKLTDPSQRFVIADLYKKLANISAEFSGKKSIGAIKDPDIFKKLTGQDLVRAERKFKEPFYFVNYAKMIFSANKLPRVDENTHAWWRRWIGLEFPNQFPEDPTFFDRTFTEREIEAGIIISLLALRNVMLRRSFTESGLDMTDKWKRLSDSVYRFVKELEEAGYLTLSPRAYVEKQRLYSLYVRWAEAEGESPVTHKRFTQRLKQEFGVTADRKKIQGKSKHVYFGIGILKDPFKEEDEEDQGVLRWA